MKMKFLERYDDKRPKGYVVEVDKIRYDQDCAGHFSVRVVHEWKQPTWFAITWFVKMPEDKK